VVALVCTRSGECYSVHAWRLRISCLRYAGWNISVLRGARRRGRRADGIAMRKSSWMLTVRKDLHCTNACYNVRSKIARQHEKMDDFNSDSPTKGLVQPPNCNTTTHRRVDWGARGTHHIRCYRHASNPEWKRLQTDVGASNATDKWTFDARRVRRPLV